MDKEVGGYRVGRALGRGAVATVYEVNDGGDGLAIKLLNAERSARSPLSAERFLREARSAARLEHPHIVGVVDHGEDERGVVYLVMERISGRTLAAHLQTGPVGTELALQVTAQLSSALAYAHSEGVVHRDLKPANVLLEADTLTARLVDFGLARDRHDLPLTATGALCGTPSYMAPELVDGAGPSSASDVYALGCLLFEMLAGQPPFVGRLPHVFRGHAFAEPPRVSSVRDDVPGAVEGLIAQCLAKDPAARPRAEAVERLCHEAIDPVAHWRTRVAEREAEIRARGEDPPPEAVTRALSRLRRALERLVAAGDRTPDLERGTVVQPGRAQALAQLGLHDAQLDRALDDLGSRST